MKLKNGLLSLRSKKRWQDPVYRNKMLARKQRGYTLEDREKRRQRFLGKKNPLWKGNKVGYGALHDWVRNHKGVPIVCKQCGKEKTTPKSIQWANLNHKYRRKLEDYIALCAKCHKTYDFLYNPKDTIAKTNKSGYKGITWSKERKKWVVAIDIFGKHLSKRFISLEEAAIFRKEKREEMIKEAQKNYLSKKL